jgi:hypothetical protein
MSKHICPTDIICFFCFPKAEPPPAITCPVQINSPKTEEQMCELEKLLGPASGWLSLINEEASIC